MIFHYTQCEQCGSSRRPCNCQTQEVARRWEKAFREKRKQDIFEATQKALAREASLKEIRRRARITIRYSDLVEFRRFGCIRSRSGCPARYSSYQGEF